MHPELPSIANTMTGRPVVLSHEERARHVAPFGKSGSGKSTLLFNLAMADVHQGHGLAVIDPHGDLAEAIIDAMPRWRVHDVCYLNVADAEYPVGFNPLASVPPERRALAAAGIVSAFKHLWWDSWGNRLEHFLSNGVAALLTHPRATLIDLPRLYTDERFREQIILRISDPIFARFWHEEFPSYDNKFRAEAASPILNRAGQFSASPIVRNILGQHTPRFDLGYAMDHQRIFIANLSKGGIGEAASILLGSLVVSHLQLLTMARSDIPEQERIPFFVHVDELANFTTDSFAGLLSEARKYRTYFAVAAQYTSQASARLLDALLGQCRHSHYLPSFGRRRRAVGTGVSSAAGARARRPGALYRLDPARPHRTPARQCASSTVPVAQRPRTGYRHQPPEVWSAAVENRAFVWLTIQTVDSGASLRVGLYSLRSPRRASRPSGHDPSRKGQHPSLRLSPGESRWALSPRAGTPQTWVRPTAPVKAGRLAAPVGVALRGVALGRARIPGLAVATIVPAPPVPMSSRYGRMAA